MQGHGGTRDQFGSVCRGPGDMYVEAWFRVIVVELERC